MGEAGVEDPQHEEHDGAPHGRGDDADAGEAAVEKHYGEDYGGDRDEGSGTGSDGGGVWAEVEDVGGGVRAQGGPEPGGVLGEADASGGDGERGGDGELDDEEEAEEAAEGCAAGLLSGCGAGVDGPEEVVGASGFGHGGAEFGPGEAVDEGEEGAEDPAEHGLGAAHGAEDEREGDEGADADHVEHVQRDGSAEREGAVEGGTGLGVDGTSLEHVATVRDA